MGYRSLKKIAIQLRNKGKSYSEIRKEVPVSRSTLSLWLRDIKLTKLQRDRLKKLSRLGQPIGAKAQKDLRIRRTKNIINKAKKEINEITDEELLNLGAVLYWAEGTKQKEHNPSQRVTFNNSNPDMINVHLEWLVRCLDVNPADITFEIYSHENIRYKEKKVKLYWSRVTGFDEARFDKIHYKKDKKKKYRKNQGKDYYGLLRVAVRKSTDLNRRITGLILGICEQIGV